jgi:hypothetical protein
MGRTGGGGACCASALVPVSASNAAALRAFIKCRMQNIGNLKLKV